MKIQNTTLLLSGLIVCTNALMDTPVSYAVEDTTSPILEAFTISPLFFDTGESSVELTICVTASDNLGGVQNAIIDIQKDSSVGPKISTQSIAFPRNISAVTQCITTTVPQYQIYGNYPIEVELTDRDGNVRRYASPNHHDWSGVDLCSIGTCSIENIELVSYPDGDADGISDIADNCPGIANASQTDQDIDLIGDACDEYPNTSNNELAECNADLTVSINDLVQCNADLTTSVADLEQCNAYLTTSTSDLVQCNTNLTTCQANQFVDEDGDGIENRTDDCSSTPTNTAVDSAGCSLAQFCTNFPNPSRTNCYKIDWKNDEQLVRYPIDCRRSAGKCIPY